MNFTETNHKKKNSGDLAPSPFEPLLLYFILTNEYLKAET